MKLVLQRRIDTGEETLGQLYLDDNFLCYTLEDTFREVKIKHITRIGAGVYKLSLRTYGKHYTRYIKKYVDILHKGMIQLMGVKKFTDILIHIGNSKKDTSGCILVGEYYSVTDEQITLVNSTVAYKNIYPMIMEAIEQGEVTMEIMDEVEITQSGIDKLIRKEQD